MNIYCIIFVAYLAVANANLFETVFSWKDIEYEFPDEATRNNYINSGEYVKGDSLAMGINKWHDKMFIIVPRLKKGVPSNLNYIWMNDSAVSPVLIPYPNLEANSIHSPNGFISIFRVKIDACDRLWGLDNGVNGVFENGPSIRPPTLVVIDLKTDQIIRRHQLKPTDYTDDTLFVDIIVDSDNCDNAFAYVSDLGANAIVVYSWGKNDSWKIEHHFFHFDPLNGDFNVSGINFQWMDGVFGMSLSRTQKDGYKTLYFHAMSGIIEYAVSTEVLQDSTLQSSKNYHAFHVVGDKGPLTQGPSSTIDLETSIDYFTQVNRNGIACWDTDCSLNPRTFILVAQDNQTLVFPNDLVIDYTFRKLYVLSNDMPTFQYSHFDPSRYNTFVTVASLDTLTPLCTLDDSTCHSDYCTDICYNE